MTDLNAFAAALVTGEFVNGKLCADCTFALANGEDDRPDQSVIEKNCKTYDFTLGHLHSGEWSDCFHVDQDCKEDCDCEFSNFSTSECTMCETTLAGSRYDCIAIDRNLLDTNMTQEQFDKLSDLCNRYNVKMSLRDYHPDFSLPAGWFAGWVGGDDQVNKTIFVGVSPQGDSHS